MHTCVYSQFKMRPGQASLHLMLVVLSCYQTRNDCAAHAARSARAPSKSVVIDSDRRCKLHCPSLR